MASPELIGIAIGVVAILMTIVGMGIVILQKMDSGDARTEERSERRSERIESRVDRVDAKVDGVKTEFDAKIDRSSAAIIAELRSFRESVEGRLNGVEREQARQEGVLSVLVQRDGDAGADREDSEG